MLDKYIYQFFTLDYGLVQVRLNAWAWRKHVKIIRTQQEKENEEYLKELKKKL